MASRQQFESDLKNFIATHKTPTVPKKSPEKEKTTSEKQSRDDGKRKFSKNNELTSSEQHALEVLKKRRPITNVSESASQPAPYLETTRTDETVIQSASINSQIAAATQYQASPNIQMTTSPNFQMTTSPNFQMTTSPNFQTTSTNFITTSPNLQTTSNNFITTSQNLQTTSNNFITTSPNLQTTSNNFMTVSPTYFQTTSSNSQKENYYDIPSNYQTSTYIDLDYQQSTSMASSLSNAMGTLYGAPEVEPSPVNQEMSCHECCRKIMHIESQLKSFQAKLEQLEQLQKDSRKPFTATPLNKIPIHENRLPLTPTESNSPSLSPSIAQLHQQVINLIGVETRPVKAIMRVMRGMFSINELSTCSMKGQPTTKFESSRPGLPDDKRNAIIDVLARKFNLSNVVTEGKVRSALRRFRDMYK